MAYTKVGDLQPEVHLVVEVDIHLELAEHAWEADGVHGTPESEAGARRGHSLLVAGAALHLHWVTPPPPPAQGLAAAEDLLQGGHLAGQSRAGHHLDKPRCGSSDQVQSLTCSSDFLTEVKEGKPASVQT